MADKKTPKDDDDSYVLEDTGETIEDLEKEMEETAQQADDTISRRGAPMSPPSMA